MKKRTTQTKQKNTPTVIVSPQVRQKNFVVLGLLVAFIVLLFMLTMARIGQW